MGEERAARTPPWPAPFRVPAVLVVAAAGGVIAAAWGLVVVVDLFELTPLADWMWQPVWWHLFNNRPVEWLQWLLLALVVLGCGYTAGRVAVEGDPRGGRFFAILGLGAGLMLIEEAGDPRHVLTRYALNHLGESPMGIHHRVFTDLPYFAVLAALPLYALMRYGDSVWRSRSARGYLVLGYGLYGLAATASAVRTFRVPDGDREVAIYAWLGARIDEHLMAGRFPALPTHYDSHAHFHILDGPIEESVELIAAAGLLAVVLAYVGDHRSGGLSLSPDSTTADGADTCPATRTDPGGARES